MTEQEFIVESRQQALPYLPRSTYKGYLTFGHSETVVLVEPGTARDLRAAAEHARPMETGGLLVGRPLRDDRGDYVIVSGFIEAGPDAGQPLTFTVSPRQVAALRGQAARAHPGSEEVGWWHSHPGPSSYSSVDRAMQRIFERSCNVGLLIFASGDEWGTAYLGPEARDLGRVDLADVPASADGDTRAPRLPVPALPPGNGPVPPLPRIREPQAQRIVTLISLAIALAIAIMVVTLWSIFQSSAQDRSVRQSVTRGLSSLSAQERSDNQRMSAQITDLHDALAGTLSVTWSCAPASGHAYDCAFTGSPGKVEWLVAGNIVASGRQQRITVAPGQPVQADLVTSRWTYAGAIRTLAP